MLMSTGMSMWTNSYLGGSAGFRRAGDRSFPPRSHCARTLKLHQRPIKVTADCTPVDILDDQYQVLFDLFSEYPVSIISLM